MLSRIFIDRHDTRAAVAMRTESVNIEQYPQDYKTSFSLENICNSS